MDSIHTQAMREYQTNKEKIPTISLSIDNLSKFPMEILYYKEQGYSKFLLEYSFEKLALPVTKIATKIRGPLIKMLQNYDIIIYLKGFPHCVFEKVLVKPHQRWYLEEKVRYLPQDKTDDYNEEFDAPQRYIDKYGEQELEPLVKASELALEYEPVIEEFESDELRKLGKIVLADFRKEQRYLRKRFVFVSSFPKTNSQSYKERFVYYINNRKDDFDKTISFIKQFFDKDEIDAVLPFVEKSNELALSFAIMSDNQLRKSFYFHVGDLDTTELLELEKVLGVHFDSEMNAGGVGLDFKDDEKDIKLYYKFDVVKKEEIKAFIKEFPIENRRKLMNILNSCTKPLNKVLLDYKLKDGEVVSKRIDLSMQFNKFKLHQLANMMSENLGHLQDKDLFTLSFEVTFTEPEKINFYYGLRIPEPEEDFEELEVEQ